MDDLMAAIAVQMASFEMMTGPIVDGLSAVRERLVTQGWTPEGAERLTSDLWAFVTEGAGRE